jgi:hypothetical protein
MADTTDSGAEDVLTTEEVAAEEPTTDWEVQQAAEAETKAARETADPNDDLAAARTDEGREVPIVPETVDVEPEEQPPVALELNTEFKVPVLEEYTDDKGVQRGKIAGYEAPSDVKIYTAAGHALGITDDDGYITLPADVPPAVAADLQNNPAVKESE